MNYREFATVLAKDAGALLKNGLLDHTVQLKTDASPVTSVDLAVDKLVLDRIQSTYSDHGIISEESTAVPTNSDFTWVIDPIDGTLPFLLGIPTSTVLIALTQNGESILGVIYDPFLDRLYVGEKGRGATLNDQPIHVSDKQLSDSVVFIEWWKGNEARLDGLFGKLERASNRLIGFASVGYEAVRVAAGLLGGGVFAGNNPWDGAAIKILVEEAGGKVTDLLGAEQRYDSKLNGMIISNGVAHEELLALVRQEQLHR